VVQRHALAALDGGTPFREGLAADPEVATRLSPARLEGCFDLAPFFRHVDALFERAGRPA
jgi:adenylosuccinate lyase